jgi:diguanylate cyclase (GGDEF)-like protein
VNETLQYRVIVVDDDEFVRKLLERQLGDAGYQVEALPDGRSALQAICQMGSGIVIADWCMPVMDGLELCRAVRELQNMQAVGNIHVIMLSAFESKEKVVDSLAAGANDYLTKPYHVGELLARIGVAERILRLQDELIRRNTEVQKANAQMACLASKLEHMAKTDLLTGLPNRRSLFERLVETWGMTGLEALPFSCLMLDVDRFKNVNDTYGHAAGDQVLKYVADAIQRHARQANLCGRLGGEEFMLIFPAAPVEAAAVAAEELRANIAARSVECDGTAVAVTVSCGVAGRTVATRCPDDLVREADAMLYLAKEHGRNQTWILGQDGRGLQFAGGQVATSTAPEPLAKHRPPAPIRVQPRANALHCAPGIA